MNTRIIMSTPHAKPISLFVSKPAAIGPGFDNFQILSLLLSENQDILLEKTNIPSTALLPPAERRRVGTVVKMAIGVAQQALEGSAHQACELATVFASSCGDGDCFHSICEALATPERPVSPTRFTNSVHNAPSGYWGIAAKARPVSTSLCAHDGSFACGLLEAAVQCVAEARPVLLIVYDAPYPQPLYAVRPVLDAFGVALLLTPTREAETVAALSLSLGDRVPTRMPHTNLENIRAHIPSARSLPLLQAIAGLSHAANSEAECVIEQFDNLSLAVKVSR